MNLRGASSAIRAAVFAASLLLPTVAFAQQGIVLSGTVSDASGKPIASAKVVAANTATGQSSLATSGADGSYTLPALTPGSYTVSFSAQGFATKDSPVQLTEASSQSLNVTLNAVSQQELPNAPSPAPQEPSLQDLGFSQQQTQANPQLQARLDKRTEMLKIHQRLGLITLASMAADLITGPMAKAKGHNGQTSTEPTQTNLDLHAALGSTTAALYFTTAYFAVFAPKVPGVQKRGAIRFHEALALVHGPSMILTPILGAMAFSQEQNGEKVHGIASAHGAVAYTTAIAYGASIVAVSWPINLKFWEKK